MTFGHLTLAPAELSLSTHPTRNDPSRSTTLQCSLQSYHHRHHQPHRHPRLHRYFHTRLDTQTAPWSKSKGGYTESTLRMSHHGSQRLLLCHLHMDRTAIMQSVPRILPMELKVVVNLESASLDVIRRIRTSSGPMDRTQQLLPHLHLRMAALSPMATMHHLLLLSPPYRKTTTTPHRTWIGPLDMRSISIVDGRMVSLHHHPRRQWHMEDLPMDRPTRLRHLGPIPVLSRQISSLHHGTRTMPTAFFPNPRLSLHTSNSARIQAIMEAVITTTNSNSTTIIRLRTAMENRLPWLESTRWKRTKMATSIVRQSLLSGPRREWDRHLRSTPSTLRIPTRHRPRRRNPRNPSELRMLLDRRT